MKTIQDFEAKLEEEYVRLDNERANQYAGLPYSEDVMNQASLQIERLSAEALEKFPEGEFSRLLYFSTILASRQSAYTRLQNEIYHLRNESVSICLNGETVNLSNWRRFNRAHLREPELRKRAFDGLMEKASVLSPLLEERFALSRDLLAKFSLDPLKVYLEEEQISLARLKQLVDSLALKAKPFFLAQGDLFAREIMGKKMEYFDDFYVFRGAIFEPVDRFFQLDLKARFLPLYNAMGFDTETIRVDDEVRAGKHASPVCFGVKIPTDVRVFYQPTSPVTDYMSFSHEMGHALHFANIDASRSFSDRYLIANGVAEIFSTLFEALAVDEAFMIEEVGVEREAGRDLILRNQFMLLYFLTFYGVNSMMKIRYWEENLSMEQADRIYGELAQKYMGLPLPGIYWQTHHVASMYDMYTPSYLLAQIRMEELRLKLARDFGELWFKEKKAGEYLKRELIGPGGAIDLDSFSRLDEGPFWKTIVPENFLM